MSHNPNYQLPLTPEAAAAEIGVNESTYTRKLRDKTGKGLKDLESGVLTYSDYITMLNHFSNNYPKAALILQKIGRSEFKPSEISDAAPIGHKSDAVKSDDTENGRSQNRTSEISDAVNRTLHKSDALKRTNQNAQVISELIEQVESLKKQLVLKDLDKEKALLEQKKNLSNELASDFSKRLASEKTDAWTTSRQISDDLKAEIGRLKAELASEKLKFRTQLEEQASDFEKNYAQNLAILEENVRLKVTEETRKAVTNTVRKEIAQEYQVKFEKQQNEHFAAIQVLNDALQESRVELHKLRADVALFNKKYSFQFKKILESELSVINVVSNILAFYGLTLVFELMGALAAVLMIFFFKNVMKNVKIAKRESAARFGMFIAYLIESVYGFFHYTTFYNLLKDKEATLLIQSAPVVAFCMTVIISGLSISALIQSRNQAKDDIS